LAGGELMGNGWLRVSESIKFLPSVVVKYYHNSLNMVGIGEETTKNTKRVGGIVHQPQHCFFHVCILFESHTLEVLLSIFVVLVSGLFCDSSVLRLF